MRIFLDDERDLSWIRGSVQNESEWTIVRTGEDCIRLLEERGLETLKSISFDHDLGPGISGHDVAKWIEEKVAEGATLPALEWWGIHSMNFAGGSNINATMRAVDRLRARSV